MEAGSLAGQVEPRQKLVFDRPLSSYVPQLSSSLLSSGCQHHRHSTPPPPPPSSSLPFPSPVLTPRHPRAHPRRCPVLLLVITFSWRCKKISLYAPYMAGLFPLSPPLPLVLSSLEHCINCRCGAKATSILIWLYVLGVAARMGRAGLGHPAGRLAACVIAFALHD